jgi:serine/threonine-protein kinase
MRGPPQVGDTIAGYRIERQLGRGGMGIVYLAEQLRLRRYVALKLILPDYLEDEDFRRRFERESHMAASLDHPNIIPVHEAGDADGALFISMRFVDGEDLRGVLRRTGRLETSRVVPLVRQVAAALDAAHARGLVHRDVKPANVLISRDTNHVYLTDFGLTKPMDSTSLTDTGRFVGTLAYIAPEQILGSAIDARVDVYSLGCMMFEALSGRVPYPRDTDIAKIYAHMEEPPPLISGLLGGDAGALDRVITKALAKTPQERFASAGELARTAEAAVLVQSKGPRPASAASASLSTGPDTSELPTREVGTSSRERADSGRPAVAPHTAAPAPRRKASPRRIVGVGAVAVLLVAVVVTAVALLGSSSPSSRKFCDKTDRLYAAPGTNCSLARSLQHYYYKAYGHTPVAFGVPGTNGTHGDQVTCYAGDATTGDGNTIQCLRPGVSVSWDERFVPSRVRFPNR